MSANAPQGPTESELRAAAETGDPQAGVEYARFLMAGPAKDVDGAMPWLEPAALAGDAFAARTLAIMMRDRGEYERAERWYRAAADHDGGCAFGLATLLEKSGDLAGAAEWYDRGAALGSLECETNGAVLLAGQHRKDEAVARLEEAERKGDHVAGDALSQMHGLFADIQECDDLLDQAEQDEDDLDWALDSVRDLRDRAKDFRRYPWYLDDALSVYDKAAEVAQDDAPLVWKALLLVKLDRWNDAQSALEKAAERFPESGFAPYVHGLMQREHGDLDKAENWLRRAVDLGQPEAMWNLAVLCLNQRRLDEAERWYTAYGERADDENDKDYEAGLERVEEYRRQPDNLLDEADEARLPDLRTAAETGDLSAAAELARLLRHKRALPEAVKWFRVAAEDLDPQTKLELGELLYDVCGADAEQVIEWFLPAAEVAHERAGAAPVADPADVDLIEQVGRFYLDAADQFKAEKWLRRAARLGHGKAAWWAGSRSDEYGDRQEAERMWALAAQGGVAWCGWLAGRSMVRRGAYAEAEPLLRIAWDGREEQEPLHEAAYWLGLSLRGQERLDEASDWLRTAVEVHPSVRRGYSGFMATSLFDPRSDLAELLCDLELDDEATALADALLQQHPKHRVAHRVAARIAARRGDPEAARAHLEHVVDAPSELREGVTAEELKRLFNAVHPR
ncbi:tetratricopeptide repeat protein [Actinomadura syzygii]|uniref:Tetratricopeptide repeat protein n=1 Tax=Actinomadura syzygii TaxID=1427538 RepID=A0A5D0ULP9_9ACTN|nr:tetratricopeptide repeat protein [Actinomadura syzygii]TYC18553.1 tetratricopeptide repeat protein [Actinomadura syzygii]